jgi:hypothetical protein
MNRGITIAIALVTLTLVGTGASACNVDSAVTRNNFKKLTACVNNLESQNAQLSKQLNSLQATVNQMDNANGTVALRALDPGVPIDATTKYGGMNGTHGFEDMRVVCPPGSWISAIQGFKLQGGFGGIEGEAQPISELRYSCRSLK